MGLYRSNGEPKCVSTSRALERSSPTPAPRPTSECRSNERQRRFHDILLHVQPTGRSYDVAVRDHLATSSVAICFHCRSGAVDYAFYIDASNSTNEGHWCGCGRRKRRREWKRRRKAEEC